VLGSSIALPEHIAAFNVADANLNRPRALIRKVALNGLCGLRTCIPR